MRLNVVFINCFFLIFPNISFSDSNSYRPYGVNFSPYADGQDPNDRVPISRQQLEQRMALLSHKIGPQWIRTFSMVDGLEEAGVIAHQIGFKVALGAWLGPESSAEGKQSNEQNIQNLIDAANRHEADLVVIGNEVILRGDLSIDVLIDYIHRVKSSIPGDIPVATADVYQSFIDNPPLITAIDTVLANIYPYWEGVGIHEALEAFKDRFDELRSSVSTNKEIIISETGWPDCGNRVGQAIPDPNFAAAFYLGIVKWAQASRVKVFYFSGFDENWKAAYEGPQGACWGLLKANGKIKKPIKAAFKGKALNLDLTGTNDFFIGSSEVPPSISFINVPPIGSTENLTGKVKNIRPSEYAIAVYILVREHWWTKPYFNNPLSPINSFGEFETDITTGGVDTEATHVAAYLVKKDYDPPLASGSVSIPNSIKDAAEAELIIDRRSFEISSTLLDFGLRKLSMKLNFNQKSSVFNLKGFITIPENFDPKGQVVSITIAGISWEFPSLDKNGNGLLKDGKNINSWKMKFNRTRSTWFFNAFLKNFISDQANLDEFGLVNDTVLSPGALLVLPVEISLNGESVTRGFYSVYQARENGVGKAKLYQFIATDN